MIEKRSIKFYLDRSVNKFKKDKIVNFLKECQQVENKLLEYYWNNFNDVINSKSWFSFYKIRIMIKEPQTKYNHHQQILHMVYAQLKSIQSNIIKRMYFKFEDKEKQQIYNYCKGFCFQWNKLIKYVDNQIKKYKDKDNNYYNFLLKLKNFIKDENLFSQIKQEIEEKFWKIKNNFKQPVKKEFQIWLYADHVIELEKKQFEWIFLVDSNLPINKKKFEQLVIPVKFSNYHKKKLENKILQKTFTLKLNKYNRIEIIAVYEIEIEQKTPKSNDIIGIDIGLKNLITTTDGEVIRQNEQIVKLTKIIQQKQINRDSIQAYLRKIKGDDNFELGNKNFQIQQNRLTNFVKCDNRYKIKQFLKNRLNDHIIMEDLNLNDSRTYSAEVNNLLKKMHIQQIKNDIIKYCKEYGIKINLINPAFTSQECPVCNFISKDNRKTQEKFSCIKCSHTDNADHNAAVNIKNRYYRKDITIKTPQWKIRQILNIV
jgi:IS605 OrfB family transposase